MKYLNSLKICNCAILEKLETMDGECGYENEDFLYKNKGAFYYIKTLEISS